MVLGDKIIHTLPLQKCSYKGFYHPFFIWERIGKCANLHNYTGRNRICTCVQFYFGIIEECLFPVFRAFGYIRKFFVLPQACCYFFHEMRQERFDLVAAHFFTDDSEIDIL
ncbi:Uncharacterised protein [Segatella buccae]|uniref:Uncharacterized protein n=1 Tax=Segatella buccae TaxID=28126 RepID=A0AAQ1UFY5_9BACT|nr:Uncharacterised protein [Segatella buccae]